MALTITATPTAANTITATFAGAASGGATVYYGASSVVTTDAAAVTAAITAGNLVLAGSGTSAGKTVYIKDLTAQTAYKIVAKDASEYAVATATTLKAKDLVANDTAKNLLESASSGIAYSSKSDNVPLETGKHVAVIVVQTAAAVTNATVEGWLDDTNSSYQIVANANGVLPSVSGVSPVLKVTAGVSYGT